MALKLNSLPHLDAVWHLYPLTVGAIQESPAALHEGGKIPLSTYQIHLHTSTEKDSIKPIDLEPKIKVSARFWIKNAPGCPPENFLEKTWKKVLTNGRRCDNISWRSREQQTNSDRNWWSFDRNTEKIEEFGLKVKRGNSSKNLEKSSWQMEADVLR